MLRTINLRDIAYLAWGVDSVSGLSQAFQELRAPVHQEDTNPEKLTAPGGVVD